MLKNTGILQGLARQKVISRLSQEAGEPDKFPISIYFPLRTYTAGKVASCVTFPPAVAPREEDPCAASGSRGPRSPEGTTETGRAQTRVGLDQECYGTINWGISWISLLTLRGPTKCPFCLKSSSNQAHAGVGVGAGAVRAAEVGAAPPDPPCHHVAVVLLQGQQPKSD